MIRKVTGAALAAAGLAALLAGCSHPPMPAPVTHRISPTAMVEAIRAARANDKSVLEITPLRDPNVNGFLDGAHADENAGKYQDALAKVDKALKLSPNSPDILQFRAEIEVLLKDFPAADADARRSWVLGSKVGGLCASNWQTVLEIAQSKNDQAGVQTARKARDACTEPPQPSF
ncbi:MAG: tetratricopeptide repeat protein [Rhodanobacteraceae bacterium]|nr:MAG: tetratricopeptide repeat protein [Rhodanobacteraceae bacterium]